MGPLLWTTRECQISVNHRSISSSEAKSNAKRKHCLDPCLRGPGFFVGRVGSGSNVWAGFDSVSAATRTDSRTRVEDLPAMHDSQATSGRKRSVYGRGPCTHSACLVES